jgi:hypothetical protein
LFSRSSSQSYSRQGSNTSNEDVNGSNDSKRSKKNKRHENAIIEKSCKKIRKNEMNIVKNELLEETLRENEEEFKRSNKVFEHKIEELTQDKENIMTELTQWKQKAEMAAQSLAKLQESIARRTTMSQSRLSMAAFVHPPSRPSIIISQPTAVAHQSQVLSTSAPIVNAPASILSAAITHNNESMKEDLPIEENNARIAINKVSQLRQRYTNSIALVGLADGNPSKEAIEGAFKQRLSRDKRFKKSSIIMASSSHDENDVKGNEINAKPSQRKPLSPISNNDANNRQSKSPLRQHLNVETNLTIDTMNHEKLMFKLSGNDENVQRSQSPIRLEGLNYGSGKSPMSSPRVKHVPVVKSRKQGKW